MGFDVIGDVRSKLYRYTIYSGPVRPVLHMKGGSQGSQGHPLVDGMTKSRDGRGPGYEGTRIRGTEVTPPKLWGSRSPQMWTPPPAAAAIPAPISSVLDELMREFGPEVVQDRLPSDFLTVKVPPARVPEMLAYLKHKASTRFARHEDLTAVDESERREKQAHGDYTLVHTLFSLDTPGYIRIKSELTGQEPTAPTVTGVWPSADWYEREVFDMFGIRFQGHQNMKRIIMPDDWDGHPLRKSHPYDRGQFRPDAPDQHRLRAAVLGLEQLRAHVLVADVEFLGGHHLKLVALLPDLVDEIVATGYAVVGRVMQDCHLGEPAVDGFLDHHGGLDAVVGGEPEDRQVLHPGLAPLGHGR